VQCRLPGAVSQSVAKFMSTVVRTSDPTMPAGLLTDPTLPLAKDLFSHRIVTCTAINKETHGRIPSSGI
jgi:hypothetical protein